jgi:hypothetical protein
MLILGAAIAALRCAKGTVEPAPWPAPARFTPMGRAVELTAHAQRLGIRTTHLKCDLLGGEAATTKGFIQHVYSEHALMGFLTARALDAHGQEVARTREPVVFEGDHGRPIQFRFAHELDPNRVATYVIEFEED